MKQRTYRIDVVVGLLLFCVFAGAMLSVLAAAAGAYKDISSAMEEQYGERTCLSYIASKARHYDTEGNVSLFDFEGVPALRLREEIDGEIYVNLIYCREGSLWELYSLEGSGLSPEDGLPVLPVEQVIFEQISPSLFRVRCRGESGYSEILIGLQSGRAVGG